MEKIGNLRLKIYARKIEAEKIKLGLSYKDF